MSTTFSTLQREMNDGRIFSSQHSRGSTGTGDSPPQQAAAVNAVGSQVQAPLATSAAPLASPDLESFQFTYGREGLPAAARIGPAALCSVSVTGTTGGLYAVTGTLNGLRPVADQAVRPTLWFVHDLIVPTDLSPADQAQLPHGSTGLGNRPGTIFTLDGNAPTYDRNANTLSISISPGQFHMGPDGVWQLSGSIDSATNQAYHPLVVLGPATMADINKSVPSGLAVQILTDLFVRPATVHPELTLSHHYQQRLLTIAQERLAAQRERLFLSMTDFHWSAITLEGLVRATPRLMPTRETCFLAARRRV